MLHVDGGEQAQCNSDDSLSNVPHGWIRRFSGERWGFAPEEVIR